MAYKTVTGKTKLYENKRLGKINILIKDVKSAV